MCASRGPPRSAHPRAIRPAASGPPARWESIWASSRHTTGAEAPEPRGSNEDALFSGVAGGAGAAAGDGTTGEGVGDGDGEFGGDGEVEAGGEVGGDGEVEAGGEVEGGDGVERGGDDDVFDMKEFY